MRPSNYGRSNSLPAVHPEFSPLPGSPSKYIQELPSIRQNGNYYVDNLNQNNAGQESSDNICGKKQSAKLPDIEGSPPLKNGLIRPPNGCIINNVPNGVIANSPLRKNGYITATSAHTHADKLGYVPCVEVGGVKSLKLAEKNDYYYDTPPRSPLLPEDRSSKSSSDSFEFEDPSLEKIPREQLEILIRDDGAYKSTKKDEACCSNMQGCCSWCALIILMIINIINYTDRYTYCRYCTIK